MAQGGWGQAVMRQNERQLQISHARFIDPPRNGDPATGDGCVELDPNNREHLLVHLLGLGGQRSPSSRGHRYDIPRRGGMGSEAVLATGHWFPKEHWTERSRERQQLLDLLDSFLARNMRIASASSKTVESRRGAVTWAMRQRSVSSPRSSNRMGSFPASGSRTRLQAFALGRLRTNELS